MTPADISCSFSSGLIMSNKNKSAIYIELHPFEKEAYLKWIQGRYHSVSEAIRCHIRKVTGLDPESQEENSQPGHGDNQQGVPRAPESAEEKIKGDGGGNKN